MPDAPRLPKRRIRAALRESYGLDATRITFLPLGYDVRAGVYRVRAADGTRYFLKVSSGDMHPPSIRVPRALRDQGITQVVAPLPTITGALWGTVENFRLLLYPFTEGQSGMEAGLTGAQWIEFGSVLRQVHDAPLPTDVRAEVPFENFTPDPRLRDIIAWLQTAIPTQTYTNPHRRELAAFWHARRTEIDTIVTRAVMLGERCAFRTMYYVLCHTDIHLANVLVGPAGSLHIVDWDQPVIAPKERDLMFIIGGRVGGFVVDERAEDLFFQGYGGTEIEMLALAYYRYLWAMQDIGEFGDQVFLMDGVSDDARREAVYWFKVLFDPDGVVAMAHQLAHVLD